MPRPSGITALQDPACFIARWKKGERNLHRTKVTSAVAWPCLGRLIESIPNESSLSAIWMACGSSP